MDSLTHFDCFVFGNSIASIAAISQLKKLGKTFLWIQDGLEVDGIWRGIKYRDRILDLGMINFEIDVRHPMNNDDLSTYSQYQINDCARFSNHVLNFILEFTSIKELPDILIFEKDELYPDHLISNNFQNLARFAPLGLKDIDIPPEFHPINKYRNSGKEALLDISYSTYVKKYFGDELADKLFLNWANKLLKDNVNECNAFRHRAAWLPLPYRETIHNAINMKLETDLTYKFHYPSYSTFSEFTNYAYSIMELDPDVQRVQLADLGDNKVKQILESNYKTFFGGKMEKLLKIVDFKNIFPIHEYRNNISIKIYEIEILENFNRYVILNNDLDDNSWYRLTLIPNVKFDNNHHILAIESKDSQTEFEEDQYFMSLGIKIIRLVKCFENIPVFLSLSGKQYRSYEKWHSSVVSQFKNVTFGGGSAFAFAASFSDQIVQGYKFARKELENV